MATNEILQFAPDVAGGDIWTQAQYVTSPVRLAGNEQGDEASRKDMNKVLLQTSTICSAIAQYMADRQAANITDQLAIATVEQYLDSSIKNDSIYFVTAGGTADVLTATFSPAMTALADGAGLIIVKAVSPNATTTPTLNCNALGAKTIVKSNSLALGIGDIVANYYMLLTYDAAQDKYVLNNPARGQASSIGSILHVRHQEADNVDGGTFTAGSFVTRPLNTVVTNTIAGASLAANTVTLPAGTYRIQGWAIGHDVAAHQVQVYDNTAAATLIIGSTANTTNAAAQEVSTTSTCFQIVTLGVTTDILLKHRCTNTQSTTGMGQACAFGIGEIYAELIIEQL